MVVLPKKVVKPVQYSLTWKRLYEEEKKLLVNTIGKYILDIQHIGSTAIPGMIAKPIIDIGVAVKDFEEAKICIKPIVNLGYYYRGEHGVKGRHYFCKFNPEAHHIHMAEINIDYWKEAPVWTPESIKKATRAWFDNLGNKNE